LELTPPEITLVEPNLASTGISLTQLAKATFNELIMSATLKPGSNYRDGSCFCDADDPNDPNDSVAVNCPAGQTCDSKFNKCVSESSEPIFCLENSECPNNNPAGTQAADQKLCLNKKYVTLIDRAVATVGWWVTKENLDTVPPLDTYADQTRGVINHTRFAEATNYGAEFGSGIKDIYQNCYLPAKGQSGTNAACGADATRPYCCNGVAKTASEWQASECFTGF
jgi:hypothetical protein